MELRYNFSRDLVQKGMINLQYIPSDQNAANQIQKNAKIMVSRPIKDEIWTLFRPNLEECRDYAFKADQGRNLDIVPTKFRRVLRLW